LYTINILFADNFVDLPILVAVDYLCRQLGFKRGGKFKCARGNAGSASGYALDKSVKGLSLAL
jgi:hypothetical protein